MPSLSELLQQYQYLGAKPSSAGIGYGNFGIRHDDNSLKGKGFFGVLQRPDGEYSTEVSGSANINGNNVSFPLIVPTLDKQQLSNVLNDNISDDIYNKAISYAIQRMKSGLSPFPSPNELIYPLPK